MIYQATAYNPRSTQPFATLRSDDLFYVEAMIREIDPSLNFRSLELTGSELSGKIHWIYSTRKK